MPSASGASIAEQLAVVRVDLSQTPESYFYREGKASSSLGSPVSTTERFRTAEPTGSALDAPREPPRIR